MPFSFDAERLAEEAEQLPDSAWMQHPSRMAGNSAVALVSRNGGDNDDFDGEMRETPHLKACPYVRQTMASFGEVFGRSRFMKLAAGAEARIDFRDTKWTAKNVGTETIAGGSRARVVKAEGLTLHVEAE